MEGNPQPTDYAAILADMEAKYAAMGNAIASLRALLATGALGIAVGDSLAFKDAVSPVIGPQGPIALPRGAFLGKTATDAVKLYLSAMRKKQTNKEISQALKDGGLESGGNFDNHVTNALFRLKQDGSLLRFDDGWGLAEWYPESFRNRVADKTAGNGKKKKKKTVRKPRNTKSAAVTPKTPNNEPGSEPKQKPQTLVEECFAAHAGKDLSTEEIATKLSMRIQTVGLICAKLAHAGKIEKTTDGRFRLSKVQQMPKAS